VLVVHISRLTRLSTSGARGYKLLATCKRISTRFLPPSQKRLALVASALASQRRELTTTCNVSTQHLSAVYTPDIRACQCQATASYIALLSQRLIAVVACGQNCVRNGYFYFPYGVARALQQTSSTAVSAVIESYRHCHDKTISAFVRHTNSVNNLSVCENVSPILYRLLASQLNTQSELLARLSTRVDSLNYAALSKHVLSGNQLSYANAWPPTVPRLYMSAHWFWLDWRLRPTARLMPCRRQSTLATVPAASCCLSNDKPNP